MTVLLDTGVLVAWINPSDPLHARAAAVVKQAMTGRLGQALSTDTVLDEGLTLLRRRPGRKEVSERFASLFFPKRTGLDWLTCGEDILEAARTLHFRHYERGLSFTDCTLIAHAEALGAAVATFDQSFEGLVEVVRP